MKCPVCKDVDLVMSERQGIEIDYCSSCRGVWLDRGELDKIIDRSAQESVKAPVQPQQQAPSSPYPQQPHYPQSHGGHHQQPYPYKKKKESWLSDLFD
jgi:Zn-finger nucleic acid-binding protein